MNRPIKEGPRTFDHFPEKAICPICQSNDDGVTVLVPIAGTEEGSIVEAKPVHLECSIIDQWDDGMQLGFSRRDNE